MLPDPSLVTIIRQAITQEIYNAFGLPRRWWGRLFMDPLFWLPTQRFALRAAQFNADTRNSGMMWAARNMLRGLVKNVCIFGAENIPEAGPLLLAGNHPGAYDGLAILSGLRRQDVRVVASGVDFTHSLPEVTASLIYVTPEIQVRMKAVRECLRHLKSGGALLIFPTGLVDPDPGLWPEQAYQILADWSHSLVLLLQRVPETKLVIVTTSHVLSAKAAYNPLTRMVKQEWQRRRLAAYIQVIQQLLLGRKVDLLPRVSFAAPINMGRKEPDIIQEQVLVGAQQALAVHLSRLGDQGWYTLPQI